jgi:hypothetical protein
VLQRIVSYIVGARGGYILTLACGHKKFIDLPFTQKQAYCDKCAKEAPACTQSA